MRPLLAVRSAVLDPNRPMESTLDSLANTGGTKPLWRKRMSRPATEQPRIGRRCRADEHRDLLVRSWRDCPRDGPDPRSDEVILGTGADCEWRHPADARFERQISAQFVDDLLQRRVSLRAAANDVSRLSKRQVGQRADNCDAMQ